MHNKSLYFVVYGLILTLLFLSGCNVVNTKPTADATVSQEAISTITNDITQYPSEAPTENITVIPVIPTRPMATADAEYTTVPTVTVTQNPIPTRPMATTPNNSTSDTKTKLTGFDIQTFRSVVNSGKKTNVIMSPLSLKQALSMVANGASGNTLSQIESVLGNNVQALNEEYSQYNNSLQSGDDCKLNIANSLWVNVLNRASFKLAFVNAVRQYYNSHVVITPFNDDTVKDINKWIKQNTDGIIEQILNSIDPVRVAYLINTVTFNARWEEPYLARDIYKKSFTSVNGTKNLVDMMTFCESVYLESETATGFVKPYKDNKFSFVALLPTAGTDIYEFINRLDHQQVNDMLNSAQSALVHATIPKFQYSYQNEMKDVLKQNGITNAFDASMVDFSGMATVADDGPLYISSVLQETHITMDELGTKAASATIVGVDTGSAPREQEIKEVALDRPFVYIIIDNTNGSPVFMGTVVEL